MNGINKEYFHYPYYFFIKENKDSLSLYYSVNETLTEARTKEDKLDFDKKEFGSLKKGIYQIIKSKKHNTKDKIKKYFEPKAKGDLEEFVDAEGSIEGSRIPIINKGLSPIKTMDQTIAMTRNAGDPLMGGYRRYYGETILKKNILEVDYSEAFGYEETKDMDGKTTYDYLVQKMDMDPDDAKKRTKQFGKDPSGKKTQKAPKDIQDKKGFIDRMTLAEIERQKMIKLIDEIILNKKNTDGELGEKVNNVSVILKKNLSAIKKLADKEGISIKQLIKMIKDE